MSSVKFVKVEAEQGRNDSLTRLVTIAFTITPYETGAPSHQYSPIATTVASFGPKGNNSTSLGWYPQILPNHGVAVIGKRFSRRDSRPRRVEPGSTVTLASAWGSAVPNKNPAQESSVVLVNESGLTQDIMVGHSTEAVVYHAVQSGCSIVVPSKWELQAYIVDDSVTYGTILRPEDLRRPVFPAPILLNTLPANSTWTVTQTRNGVVRIGNDQYGPAETEVGSVPEALDKKGPLSEILERLATIEKSIARVQNDVATGQKAIDDLHNRFSILERVASTKDELQEVRSSIKTVEAEAAALTGSFGENQDRLSIVHKAVTETQQLLSGMKKSTGNRISALEEITSQARNHVVTVEKAIQQTQDHVYLVQQMVLTKQPSEVTVPEQTSHSTAQALVQSTRIPTVEERVDKLEKSVQDQRKALRGLDRRMVAVEKVEASLAAVQASVASLNRRMETAEGGSEDDDTRTRGLSSPPSAEGSPVMFPNHMPENS